MVLTAILPSRKFGLGELVEGKAAWNIGGVKADDLMRDPRFAPILMKIEGRIHDSDMDNLVAGKWIPKDSAVKSALRKAELALGGKKPSTKPKGEEEEWVAALSGQLVELGKQLLRDEGLPVAYFALGIKATQGSLETQREMAGHSRGYLDFLEGFVKQARGEASE